MPGYKDVLHALETCETAAEVQRACGIPPSRLQRIMRGPRFRRELELEREFVAFRGRREAHKAACLAADTLANALGGRCEREVRLAAGAVVRLALREARRETAGIPNASVRTPAGAKNRVGKREKPCKTQREPYRNMQETMQKPIRKARETGRTVQNGTGYLT